MRRAPGLKTRPTCTRLHLLGQHQRGLHRFRLHLEGLLRPSLAAGVAVFLKLVLMPAIAVALGLKFGLADSNLAIVTVCSAVPAASSAYVLARQMGGDAPLLAQIITLQTILAAVTMPVAIALAAMY